MRGVITQTNEALLDYFKTQYAHVHELLIKSCTQNALFSRIFDKIDPETLPGDLIALLDNMPGPKKIDLAQDAIFKLHDDELTEPLDPILAKQIENWVKKFEKTVDLIFKNENLLTQNIQQGLGIAFFHEISKFIPAEWDLTELPEEIALSAYKLFLKVYTISWQVNEEDLTEETIGTFIKASIRTAAGRVLKSYENAGEGEPHDIEKLKWTKFIGGIHKTKVNGGSRLSRYSFEKALKQSNIIRTGLKKRDENDSKPKIEDPILNDINDFIRIFNPISFAPTNYASDASVFPEPLRRQAHIFIDYYNKDKLSNWIEETTPIIFSYLFNPDLSLSGALINAGITDEDIEYFSFSGKMKTEKLSHLIFSMYFIKYMQFCFILMSRSNSCDLNLIDYMQQLGEIFDHIGSLKLGFDYDEINYNYIFSIKNNEESLRSLSENDKILKRMNDDCLATLFILASQRGHLSILKDINALKPQAMPSNEAFCSAAEHGKTSVVSHFAKANISRDIIVSRGGKKYTPALLAAKNGHSTTVKYFLKKANFSLTYIIANKKMGAREKFESMIPLVESGADVNYRGSYNWGPLHAAVIEKNSTMIQYLIDQGANVNAIIKGWSPLARSVHMHGREWYVSPMIRCLLANNADYVTKSKIEELKVNASAIDLVFFERWHEEWENRFKYQSALFDFLVYNPDIKSYNLSYAHYILLLQYLRYHKFHSWLPYKGDIKLLRIRDMKEECRSIHIGAIECYSDFWKALLIAVEMMPDLKKLDILDNDLTPSQIASIYEITKKRGIFLHLTNDDIQLEPIDPAKKGQSAESSQKLHDEEKFEPKLDSHLPSELKKMVEKMKEIGAKTRFGDRVPPGFYQVYQSYYDDLHKSIQKLKKLNQDPQAPVFLKERLLAVAKDMHSFLSEQPFPVRKEYGFLSTISDCLRSICECWVAEKKFFKAPLLLSGKSSVIRSKEYEKSEEDTPNELSQSMQKLSIRDKP